MPFVPLPTPRITMPLALMLTESEIGYTPAVSSKAPRKPFASGVIAAIWSRAFWMFA